MTFVLTCGNNRDSFLDTQGVVTTFVLTKTGVVTTIVFDGRVASQPVLTRSGLSRHLFLQQRGVATCLDTQRVVTTFVLRARSRHDLS